MKEDCARSLLVGLERKPRQVMLKVFTTCGCNLCMEAISVKRSQFMSICELASFEILELCTIGTIAHLPGVKESMCKLSVAFPSKYDTTCMSCWSPFALNGPFEPIAVVCGLAFGLLVKY